MEIICSLMIWVGLIWPKAGARYGNLDKSGSD